MITITKEMLESSKGDQGFTKPQGSMSSKAISNFPSMLKGRIVEETWWAKFCRMGEIGAPLKKPAKKKPSKKKKKRGKKWKGDNFYLSNAWRELRYRVIRKYGAQCMACGRSPKRHGVVIHCDHIKPRSKYPHLELVFENLQLLCEDCNLGKSNIDETDWRPGEEAELEIVAAANERI